MVQEVREIAKATKGEVARSPRKAQALQERKMKYAVPVRLFYWYFRIQHKLYQLSKIAKKLTNHRIILTVQVAKVCQDHFNVKIDGFIERNINMTD